nr:hypothetical protein [Tanacetum cinerariifolium]
MDAPTLSVSAEKNLGDPIEIRVDIVHPAPVDIFPAATVEMSALRFRMGMAEEENASLRGRIKTIEAIDTVTCRQEKGSIMPTTRQGANVVMTLEAVQAMIDQTLLRNNTTDDGSQNSDGGPRRPMQPARVCSYTNFMKCQPLNFKGTEGVVGLSQWFEEMKSVFHISSCAVENQKLRTYAKRQAGNKRKVDNNKQAQQQLLKKHNVFQTYVVGTGEKKPYGGSKPLCPKCNYHHDGECAPKYTNCKKVGYLTKNCWHPINANNQRTITCYECENQGHYMSDCPVLKNQVEMSGDVLTVGSNMRILLLYRGEYSQWVERFMNYLEEQTDGEA